MITLVLFRRTVQASVWALLLLDLFVLVVWAASGAGSFWPVWVWLPTGLAIASAWWVGAAPNRLAKQAGEAVLRLAVPDRRLGRRGTRVVLARVADRRARPRVRAAGRHAQGERARRGSRS